MMMMILPYSKILIDAEWPGMMYPEVCWGGTDSIHNHTTKRYKITFNIRLIGEGGEKRKKMRLLWRIIPRKVCYRKGLEVVDV